jgi:hypothetical protein
MKWELFILITGGYGRQMLGSEVNALLTFVSANCTWVRKSCASIAVNFSQYLFAILYLPTRFISPYSATYSILFFWNFMLFDYFPVL